MPIMLEKLYDALRAADVPDDKARAAAVEGADYDNRLTAIEARLAGLEARFTMLIWIVGVHFAVTLAGLGLIINRLSAISARLPH